MAANRKKYELQRVLSKFKKEEMAGVIASLRVDVQQPGANKKQLVSSVVDQCMVSWCVCMQWPEHS